MCVVSSFVKEFEVIDQPLLVPRNNRGQFLLKEDAIYIWEQKLPKTTKLTRCKLVIKKGFITDIASIPKWCAIFGFTPDGPHRAGSVLHDLLYQLEGRLSIGDSEYDYFEWDTELNEWVPKERILSRKDCDELFKQGMIATGTFGGRSWVIHKVVNVFGKFAW